MEKVDKNKNDQNQNQSQNQLNELLEEQKKTNQALLTQVQLLQEQLQQGKQDEEEKKLASEAERIRKDQEALAEEANIRTVLANAARASESESKKVDDLTPTEMLSIMSDAVGRSVDASTKLTKGEIEGNVAKLVTPLNEKIEGLQKVIIQLMAGMSVKQAKDKFTDFDTYTEDVRKILKDHPTLSPESAYLLAKAQKASSVPPANQTNLERPSYPPSPYDLPRETGEEETPRSEDAPVNPRAIFRDAASKAIDKVLAERMNRR